MDTNLTINGQCRKRMLTRILTALVMAGIAASASASVGADQSKLPAPTGDGWQMLSPGEPAASALVATAPEVTSPHAAEPTNTDASIVPPTSASATATGSLSVAPVVVPGVASAHVLTFTVAPQDINLRNAMDRWLETQGWQLAWSVQDDLPLEFTATFSGDFTSVLEQVMKATNHMRTPTRICRHTNHVIRVIARAATCKD